MKRDSLKTLIIKWCRQINENCFDIIYIKKKSLKMKLSLSRYRSVLLVQISLLVVDLLINTFCEYLRFESVILLVVFVIQDVCLVFSLIIVFLSFFSTYIFQAGLVGVLVQQFRTPIIVTVIYIGMLSSILANKKFRYIFLN